jgi:hypothetical protein
VTTISDPSLSRALCAKAGAAHSAETTQMARNEEPRKNGFDDIEANPLVLG